MYFIQKSVLATLLILTSGSYGFFPQKWKEVVFGAGGVSHVEQTEIAFQALATEYFPKIDHLTKNMIKARDTISQANADVDANFPHTAACHIDGESFDAAQTRLAGLKAEVKNFLAQGKPDVDSARKSLGSALHTIQDFYAHSNWVEMGNTGAHPTLGRDGSYPYAGPLSQTCGECIQSGILTVCNDCSANEAGFGELTSGYYFGEDVVAPPVSPAFKCHHGGFTDNTFGSEFGFVAGKATNGINKDSLNCGFSPHASYHHLAVTAAIAATKQFIDDIKKEITQPALRALFGVGPTLAFVIDTTGSMSDIIASVQSQSIAIVNERIGTPDEPSNYVIAPFNDPDVPPVTVTTDFDVFKSTINSLYASGGGDCPELSMTGMLGALDVMEEESFLFMLTDAASKDYDLAGEVISVAVDKSIPIYIFKFDSGCDDGVAKRVDSASDTVYGAVAAGTSGQYHSLPRAQVSTVGTVIEALVSVDSVYVLRIVAPLTAAGVPTQTYTFPVDSLMKAITIALRGATVSMAVSLPDGTALDLSGAGVTNDFLRDGQVITVATPVVGKWTIIVTSSVPYTVDVTGNSPLHLSSFTFAQLSGRPGHQGFYPLTGPTPYGAQIAAIGEIDGLFNSAVFEFRTSSGKLVKTIPMKPGSGNFGDPPANSFFTLLTVDPGDFFVYLSGLDGSGAAYRRVLSQLVSPVFSNTTFNVSTTAFPSSTSLATFSSSTSSSASTTSSSSLTSVTPCSGFSYSTITKTATSKYDTASFVSSKTRVVKATTTLTVLSTTSIPYNHCPTTYLTTTSCTLTTTSTDKKGVTKTGTMKTKCTATATTTR